LRGQGDRRAPAGVYTMAELAHDVLALLDSLSVQRAVWIGHSMGGYVTLAAWATAPERFAGMGLIDTQATADSEEAKQGRYQLAVRVAAEGSKVVADAMPAKLLAPGVAATDPIFGFVRQVILDTKAQGIQGTLQGMAVRPDVTPLLPTISVPVLVLSGDSDQVIPVAKAEDLAAAIPGARLVKITSAGHLPMLEQSEKTTQALGDFLGAV